MYSKLWIRRAVSMCSLVAVLATYSMVALGGTDRIAGELTITGNGLNNETPAVTVNGEIAKSGRSIFSSSIVETPSNAGAVINLGKSGIIQLAPNSVFTISFDNKSISGELSSGKLTVLGASSEVTVKTAAGAVKASTGDSVNASGKKDDDPDSGGGPAWWLWAIVFGGAAAGILIAATTADNRVSIGGTAITVSPNR
jgi:phage baseplate assembly protein gpV